MSETVEGWSNYPTWAVNLWLANDRDLSQQARVRVAAVTTTAPASDWEDTHRGDVSRMLKEWVTDQMPDLANWKGPNGPTCAESLLSYALGEVDWYELAQEWLTNVKEATA